MSASMLALLDYCDACDSGQTLDPRQSHRKVVGIDIDIRAHNREALDAHPLRHKIELIEGSSVDSNIAEQVAKQADGHSQIMVFLDSNHTHDHVLQELELYAPLVSKGSYCVVWDTGVEDLPDGMTTDRPWGKGNNPRTALLAYLDLLQTEERTARDQDRLAFELDRTIEHKIVLTASRQGFLKRV